MRQSPEDQRLFPHPDFELYDNLGRTTEQIHAFSTRTPTREDLHHWAIGQARPLLDEAALPASGNGITAWTDLLGRAATPQELYAVLDAVLISDDSALARVHQFIETLANWYDERGDEPAMRRYRTLADDLDAVYADLDQLAVDHLIAADRIPTQAAPPTAAPRPPRPAPPTTPPTQSRR